jgi:UDP-3-O-[3-hydroxymyristoyl] glucosamine N-acyltransferase
MLTYILGNGGYAHEIYDQFLSNKDFGGFITLTDDIAYLINEDGINQFLYPAQAKFVVGTGAKQWRKAFINHFTQHYVLDSSTFPNFIHSSAYISKLANLGVGNVLGPFSTINGNAYIKDFNCLNIYSSISHDCVVGSYNILSPYSAILGYCYIGNNNFFSANCTVTPKLKVGDNNTISAGECLFEDMGYREFFRSGIVTKKL